MLSSLCLIGLHLAARLAAATAIFIQQQKQFISLETEGWRSGEEDAWLGGRERQFKKTEKR